MRSKISGHKLRKKSLIVVMVTNASIRTAPATQVDSQPDIGEGGLVCGPTAPTPLNPGPFESCDEDMLFDTSEAEDEREGSRSMVSGNGAVVGSLRRGNC